MEGSKTKVTVTIPPNTTAKIVLPGTADQKITESGTAIDKVKAISHIKSIAGNTELMAGSGTYQFEYESASKAQQTSGK
ncbi:hypothetical protein D3C86_1935510 [compost metagenome]